MNAAIRQIAERAQLPETVMLEALEWLVLSWSGEMTAGDSAALARWRAAAPSHEQAWFHAQQLGDKLNAMPGAVAADSLRAADGAMSRRKLLLALSAVACGGLSVATLRRTPAVQGRWADLRTTTGEIRSHTLPDGTGLTLNTASAVNIAFDRRERRLILIDGEILVTTAPDPLATNGVGPRPLIVESAQGRVRPIGTRFTVRRDGAETRVGVLAGAVDLRPSRHGVASTRLRAGEAAGFTVDRVRPLAADTGAAAWVDGLLVAEQMPLDQFLAELDRYRSGIIRCHANTAGLRVSGTFSIHDTDSALEALAEALPIRIVSFTRYWVSVEAL